MKETCVEGGVVPGLRGSVLRVLVNILCDAQHEVPKGLEKHVASLAEAAWNPDDGKLQWNHAGV